MVEASGIVLPAMRDHILCVAHVIQLALGAFMSSLGVSGCTKSWEAHERDQPFGENESAVDGKSQRLRREGNAGITSGINISVWAEWLRQSRQRHPIGRLLRTRRQYHTSRCILHSDGGFTISPRSVGLLISTYTLVLWPTVTIHWNGFIGYVLASGLQCNR